MLFKSIFCFTFVFCSVSAACYEYNIPTPSITAYKPRGLSISIPNDTGVDLVIFYVSVNKDISNIEADHTQYVVEQTNGKWSFDNQDMKVKNWDVVYYKIFVQRYNRGYIYRGTPYIITERHKRPTSESTRRREEYDDCFEITTPEPSSTTVKPTTEVISSTAALTTSTTPQSASTERNDDCTSNLNSLLKLLLDTQAELESVKTDLEVIKEIALSQPLHLRMSGPATVAGDPKEVIEFVIFEKLNSKQNVKSATRDGTTITFELFSFDQKVDILKRAKKYLKDSPNLSITT